MNTPTQLAEKLQQLEDLKSFVIGTFSDVEKVKQACKDINKSWSGSSLTTHAKYYFQNYQEPPVRNRFNIEWGLINGVPNGWVEKTNEEITKEIEDRAGVNLEDLKSKATKFEEDFASLKKGVVLELVELGITDIVDIEGFKFKSATNYFNDIFPSSFRTRDSSAVSSGTYIVPQIYFEAIMLFLLSAPSQIEDLIYQINKKMKLVQQTLKKQEASDFAHIHNTIKEKCLTLYNSGAYAEAVEKSFKIVKDELRKLTSYESGSEAFGKGGLHIKGASAQNVDDDFNQAAKFLMMAIDMFRNEKSHTSDAKIVDPIRAYQYLAMSSLALSLLENSEIKSK